MEYDLRRLQLKVLDILKAVDEMCRKHGLRYYIMAGTLLGAVRNGGFIPWDDDLDIAMPRADYDLFLKNASSWLPAPYEAVAGENDPSYPLPFAKIQDASTTLVERAHLHYLGGVYIDVFPLDGVPAGKLRRTLHFAKYEFYKRALYFVHRDPYKHGRGLSSWLPLLARRIYSLQSLQTKIRKVMRKYDFDQSRLVADYDDGSKGVMPKTWVGAPRPIRFEDITAITIAEAEKYLEKKYGDYMTPPEGAHRKMHNFHYLDLDTPYRKAKL